MVWSSEVSLKWWVAFTLTKGPDPPVCRAAFVLVVKKCFCAASQWHGSWTCQLWPTGETWRKTSLSCRGQRRRPLGACENVRALYKKIYINKYIHIFPPLGAYKSQLGGTYIIFYCCCFIWSTSTVIIRLYANIYANIYIYIYIYNIYIYIFMYIHIVILLLVFCT